MKLIICLVAVLVMAFNLNQPITFITMAAAAAEDLPALHKKSTEECIKQGSLNGEDTKRIMAYEIFSPKYNDVSEKLKCFLSCYYNKIGIIDAAGKKKIDVFVDYMQNRFPDKKDKIQPAIAKCDNVKSSNPCELIYQFEACIVKNLM